MLERYSSTAMRRIWSEEHKLETWLCVELAAAAAQAKLGLIPNEAYRTLKARARVNLKRTVAIERVTNHDVIAFVSATAQSAGAAGRYLHYGLTSSDVVDTAMALRLREASDLIEIQLARLDRALLRQAKRYRHTVMIGRSHGVHAEPITFGLRLAVFLMELRRQRARFAAARRDVEVGMFSGAVGTYAHQDPRVEDLACRKLGLSRELPSTQIVARDRHAAYVSALAQIGGTLENLAVEIRHLQRTEVREVEEFFAPGQKGSSAMPHKRNPILCERITGLARLLRGYALAAFEDMALWHERDISHSSVERMILPDATAIAEYQARKAAEVVETLQVYPERMRRNLELTRGLIHSQQVLLTLVRKGFDRDQAYRKVQTLAMQAWKHGTSFKDLVCADREISARLTPRDLAACFDLAYHTKYVDRIFRQLKLN
jgi:adenylosuccinate lyase